MSPMQAIAWVTGDRYTGREMEQRGDACADKGKQEKDGCKA